VKAYYETEAYKKASRKRSVWVEPLFGEAKDFHRLRRFRLRGLHKVNIEGVMIAAGQNLKRLIKHRLEKLCFCIQILISRLIPASSFIFSTPWRIMRQVCLSSLIQDIGPVCLYPSTGKMNYIEYRHISPKINWSKYLL
jgi:hypothetical protein